jgi:hypothetical protein
MPKRVEGAVRVFKNVEVIEAPLLTVSTIVAYTVDTVNIGPYVESAGASWRFP